MAKIYLVGAGPGDPDLLTIRAERLLREASVVLYDHLVSPAILALASPSAELHCVGKHQGQQQEVQERIYQLLLHHGRQAEGTVVRLKSGDPLVFGRGAEEWLFLAEHGLDAELVPGLSSAIAVPSLAGIPVTFRGVAQSFAVITGHCWDGFQQHWERYREVDTLVILMGVKDRASIAKALLQAGRPAEEPVAFIERGSTPQERVVQATLGAVAAGETEVQNPAVFVVGEVVSVRGLLQRTQQAVHPIPAAASV